MYIEQINNFLDKYENFNRKDFLLLLAKSNKKKFIISKLEKDFLLTIVLIKF
jgi:hypothetical protein